MLGVAFVVSVNLRDSSKKPTEAELEENQDYPEPVEK